MARADKWLWVALGAAVVVIGGCSRDGSNGEEMSRTAPLPDGMIPCEEIYADNKPVDPKTFGDTCAQGKEMVTPRPIRLTCSDKRVLFWNQFAWGYQNEEMTLISEDDPAYTQVPYDQAVECLKATAADDQAALRDQLSSYVIDDDADEVAAPS